MMLLKIRKYLLHLLNKMITVNHKHYMRRTRNVVHDFPITFCRNE